MTQAQLRERWNACTSPIYRVLANDGAQIAENMANAKVRRDGKRWLYVDEVDGFDVLSDKDVSRFILEHRKGDDA